MLSHRQGDGRCREGEAGETGVDERDGQVKASGDGGGGRGGAAAAPAVTARLFAGLEGLARERRVEWRVPATEAATVNDLCASVGLPAGVAGLVLVNGVHADATTPLHDGDEVSLFPPVGGG